MAAIVANVPGANTFQRYSGLRSFLLAGTALAALGAFTGQAAADCGFTITGDAGAGSFRNCVDDAVSGDTVSSGLIPPADTVTLTSGPVIMDKSLTLGGALPFTLSGDNITTLQMTGGGHTLNVGQVVTIQTAGAAANRFGIHVIDDANVVNVAGRIETSGPGNFGWGIYVNGDDNTVDLTGSIETSGASGRGIRVIGAGNVVNLSETSNIETGGPSSAAGIEITGGSKNVVNVRGEIVSSGTGIITLGGDNTVNIFETGIVTTSSNDGVSVGSGSNTVNLAGRIEAGSSGIGIRSSGSDNLINILASGSILTNSGNGINAVSGDAEINLWGSIETLGNSAFGMLAASGSNLVNVSGSIQTAGSDSSGIRATGGSDMVNVAASGSILTQGDDAIGIFVGGGNSTVDVSGKIKTEGDHAFGISADDGDNSIDVSGSIETEGVGAHGIRTFGGNNEITVAGSIMTAGSASDGIRATEGDNVINVAESGSIVIEGGSGYGIYVNGGGNKLDVSGSIVTTSFNARGIFASGGENEINVSGSIVTTGGLSGIRAMDGNNRIILSGSVSATGGADAISFLGGGNRLELQQGYAITGNVVGSGTDTLTLGGAGNASFDVEDIGAGLKFSGFDSFDKRGMSTWTLTGVNTDTDWDVLEGTLAGTATIGNVTVHDGGTIAPGNSIGTLTVADITFQAGSFYEVEVNGASASPVAGTNNDLIDVTGTATFNGGTVQVVPYPDFLLDTPYTILSSTNTLVVNAPASAVFGPGSIFITPSLSVDGNDVLLTLTQTTDFADVAGTPNQAASAAGAQSAGTGSPVFMALALLNDENDARNAFDQLSGEAHASGKTALINNSARLRTVINNRINSAFGGAPSSQSFPIMGYGPSTGLVDLPPAHRYGAWAQAYGAWGSTSATANTAALRQDDRGFLIGADGHLGGAWYGGVFTGYGRTSFRADSRSSSGSSDNLHLGAYAGGELGAFNLNLGAAHTWHSVGTTRSVAFPGFTDTLTASYSARTMQLFGEASYRIDAGSARFEPFAGLAHVNLHTNGFTEAGGAAALTSAASSTSTTFSTIGVRAATGFHMGDMKATARTMIGWRHAFGNTAPTSSFALAGGNSFVVSGAPIARNTAVLELGLDMEIGKNATFGLSYDGQFGSGTTSHSANARLGVSF